MQISQNENPAAAAAAYLQPWLLLATGFFLGQTTTCETSKSGTTEKFYHFIEHGLIPLYTAAVLVYLGALVLRTYVLPKIKGRLSPVSQEEVDLQSDAALDEVSEEMPVDMTGRYKLVSVENFDSFLEVQGVPWALRKAACRARPTHKITHRGRRITIRIEGILNTQTTYLIDGPPIEVNIRGRKFDDRITYLDNGEGIRGIKTAVSENYDVIIDRVLSEDKRKIVLTGRAEFNDGRETIESVQIFERIQ